MTKKIPPKWHSMNSKEFLNRSLLLLMICFPGGCGTNAGNPFLETEADDSPEAKRSPTGENIPPPIGTARTPQKPEGKPIIADCPQASSIKSGTDAAGCSAKTPEAIPTQNNTAEMADVISNRNESPAPVGAAQPPGGLGTNPTPQNEIPGISKSRSEIISELKMSARICSLVGIASANKPSMSLESGLQDGAASGGDFSSANSLLPGPVISISLAEGFKKSSVAVIAVFAAEGPNVLENGARISAGKDFTIGVYDANALICVHRGTLELSQTTASEIKILLNTAP